MSITVKGLELSTLFNEIALDQLLKDNIQGYWTGVVKHFIFILCLADDPVRSRQGVTVRSVDLLKQSLSN
ncbi:hypothetical protein LH51_18045 [Nitrincola sp. A-D6]|nr:hypothetical protein LH51_18045 [Nitrincola sp. A-D6]